MTRCTVLVGVLGLLALVGGCGPEKTEIPEWRGHMDRALEHQQNGKLPECESEFRVALELGGKESSRAAMTVLKAMDQVYQARNEHQKRVELWKAAIAREEKRGEADPYFIALSWHDLGASCAALDRFEEAARANERAIELYGKSSNPKAGLNCQTVRANQELVLARIPKSPGPPAPGSPAAAPAPSPSPVAGSASPPASGHVSGPDTPTGR